MPCAQVECLYCKKNVRSDKYAAHCISNHSETILNAMPARRKKAVLEDLKVPLITIYSENQSPAMTICLHCKKYCNKDSERNRNSKMFSYEHKRTDCAKVFDNYKSLFEVQETPEIEIKTEVCDELTEIKKAIAEVEPMEEDDERTTSEYIRDTFKMYKKNVKTQRDINQRLRDEIERLKAELENCKKPQAEPETEEFVDKSEDFIWDLRNDMQNKCKANRDVFTEQILMYDKYEFKALHQMYDEYINAYESW